MGTLVLPVEDFLANGQQRPNCLCQLREQAQAESVRLASVLFPVPVEIRQSNITGKACFLSCFAPSFGLGV